LLEKGETADSQARTKALIGAYLLEWRLGNFAVARAFAEENLALQRELDNPIEVAYALVMLANVVGDDNRRQAEELLQASLGLARESGDTRGMATALNNLGEIARQNGEYARAGDYYGQVVELNQVLKTPETLSLALHNLGQVALACGDYHKAAEHFRAGLEIYRELEHKTGVAMCLAGLAGVMAAQGQASNALRLAAAVESLLGEINGHLDSADQAPFEAHLARARVLLGEERFLAQQAEARSLFARPESRTTLAQTIEFALSV
jgi:tetratricopeptide (TPR) repeat protein